MKTIDEMVLCAKVILALLFMISSDMLFAKKDEHLYMVIDISGGVESENHPISYLSDVPNDGWSDEYKKEKIVLRKIKAGTFMSGSPATEYGLQSNESLHKVTLSKDYYIGVFEMTQRQWFLLTGKNPSYFQGEMRPVGFVSYRTLRGRKSGLKYPKTDDVDDDSFMGIMRKKTNLQIDLPTFAQWEYACRAKTKTALNSGKEITSLRNCPNVNKVGHSWFNGGTWMTYGKHRGNSAHRDVGCNGANGYGLYDMHANVWEWCLDWYGNEHPKESTDPKGPETVDARVICGGGWGDGAYNCRSASHSYYWEEYENSSVGFRLVVNNVAGIQ